MLKSKQAVTVTILGDGAILRRSGVRAPVVAKILGVENDINNQPKTVWFDRFVHDNKEDEFVGWQCSGEIMTILERRP